MALVAINKNPSARFLSQFGFANVAIFAAVGAWVKWKGSLLGYSVGDSSDNVAMVFWGLSALSGLASLFYPKANLPIYFLLAMVTFPIGFVMSYVILFTIYFFVITPIGLLMRVLGKDSLDRAWNSSATSYWKPRTGSVPVNRYFKQF
jgi:hypothetical protein